MTVAATCFGLHKPSSGSSQPVLCLSQNVGFSYIYRCFEVISVLWLHNLFCPVMRNNLRALFGQIKDLIQWRYSPRGPWPTERPPLVSEASANFCG